MHRRTLNTVKYLRWSFLQEYLLLLPKAPSQTIDRILYRPPVYPTSELQLGVIIFHFWRVHFRIRQSRGCNWVFNTILSAVYSAESIRFEYAVTIPYLLSQASWCKLYAKSWSRNCPKVIIKWDTFPLFPLFPVVILNTTSETSCGVLASTPKELAKEGWPRGVSNPISGCELGKTPLSKYTAPKDVM